jgi:hypothetical protein
MIRINLIPKKQRKETLKRLKIQLSACTKWINWHNKRVIRAQDIEIRALRALLSLYGVPIYTRR